ncbi:MAG: 6-carboxytetrahydropterin synthase QueD [Chloroflexi bacterium]|nr:6-carboxytetrahydropterin synthase QueD [Chloroflexota bacterium]
MSESFAVNVNAVKLRFASAHMATLGKELEPLHGHNYIVSCTVEGDITDDEWVIDFSVIKDSVRDACKILDHKFILQKDSSILEIKETSHEWQIEHDGHKYLFPKNDVVALNIKNTTAENLAKWLFYSIKKDILTNNYSNIHNMTIEVEEMPGQSGIYKSKLK